MRHFQRYSISTACPDLSSLAPYLAWVLDLFPHFWRGKKGKWRSKDTIHESLIRAESGLRTVVNVYLQYTLLALGKMSSSDFISIWCLTHNRKAFLECFSSHKRIEANCQNFYDSYKSDGHIGLKRNFHQKRSHRANWTRTLRTLWWTGGGVVSEPYSLKV